MLDGNTTTTVEDTCKTKYIHLEMIFNKDGKFDVVVDGLFKGMIEKDTEKYILLHGISGSTNILNCRFYNIMTIEELNDDFKNMAYATKEAKDQEEAMSIVSDLYKCIIAAGFGMDSDPTIIDITKYKDVPKEYLEGKDISKVDSKAAFNNVTTTAVNKYVYYPNRTVQTTTTVIKKDPEPAVFLRADNNKRPTKTVLDVMESKLDLILAGTFKPTLPEMKEDEKKNDEVSNEIKELYLNEYNGYYG